MLQQAVNNRLGTILIDLDDVEQSLGAELDIGDQFYPERDVNYVGYAKKLEASGMYTTLIYIYIYLFLYSLFGLMESFSVYIYISLYHVYDLRRYPMSDISASCTQSFFSNAEGVAFC